MPIDPRPYPRPASSEPACRAVVAVRLHAPARAEALLRRLRIRVMQGGLLDDPALIDAAAAEAGLDPTELAAWYTTDAVASALEADAAAARDPLPAARALEHKLGGPPGQRRYNAPTYVIDGTIVPGFNPVYYHIVRDQVPFRELGPDWQRQRYSFRPRFRSSHRALLSSMM